MVQRKGLFHKTSFSLSTEMEVSYPLSYRFHKRCGNIEANIRYLILYKTLLKTFAISITYLHTGHLYSKIQLIKEIQV